MTKNRNPVKRWFITFPNSCESDTTKQTFEAAFPPHEFYTCCEEDHQSGKKHLHACIILKKPLSQSKLIKYLEATYPAVINSIHCRPVRDLQNTLDYVKKEDSYYVETGSLKKDGLTKTQKDMENWFITNGFWDKDWRTKYEEDVKINEIYRAERIEKLKELRFKIYGF